MQRGEYNGSMKADYLKPDNYGKLFVFMQYPNTLALRVSLETGMRIGDVLRLTPDALRGRTVTYTAQKTGKRGKVVVSQDLANRLRDVAGERYIFEGRGREGHRTRQTVWKDVKKAVAALRAAGVITGENISPHSARKTFAVEDMERHGILHTQKALQHSNKFTTQIYTDSDKAVAAADWFAVNRRLDSIEEKIEELLALVAITGNSGNNVDKTLENSTKL